MHPHSIDRAKAWQKATFDVKLVFVWNAVGLIWYTQDSLSDITITMGHMLVKLEILVESDPNAPFSISTTPRCRGGYFSIPWIAPLYP